MVALKETQAKRLDRIEEKIDKLSEAMIMLARTEEKINAIEKNSNNQYERLNRLSQKIDDLQRETDEQRATITNFNRLFWIVIVATVGAIITSVRQFFL